MRSLWYGVVAALSLPSTPVYAEGELELVLGSCVRGRAVALVELGQMSHRLEPIDPKHLESLATLAAKTPWYAVSRDGKSGTKSFSSPKVLRSSDGGKLAGRIERDKVLLGTCSSEHEIYATKPVKLVKGQAASPEASNAIRGVVFEQLCPPPDEAAEYDCPRGTLTASSAIGALDARLILEDVSLHSVKLKLTPATGDSITQFAGLVRAPEEGKARVLDLSGAYSSPNSKERTTVEDVVWIEYEHNGRHLAGLLREEYTRGKAGTSRVRLFELPPGASLETVEIVLSSDVED